MRDQRLAVVVLALLSCAACASARGQEIAGLFDGADKAAAAPATGVAVSESAPAARRGVFDFDDVSIEGELVRPEGAYAAGAAPAPSEKPAEPPVAKPEGSEGAGTGARQVIYTGAVSVIVPAVVDAADRFAARVTSGGGYVQSRSGNAAANMVSMTVRVPAAQFFALVKELAVFGQIASEQLDANDVTKQMFDLQLRLETAERSRQRLLDLLKQATKMEEILQIENEARRLTDEIERMKGELRFLADQVAMSTLTVTFTSNAPPPTTGPARGRSRFDWVNQVGIEQVWGSF